MISRDTSRNRFEGTKSWHHCCLQICSQGGAIAVETILCSQVPLQNVVWHWVALWTRVKENSSKSKSNKNNIQVLIITTKSTHFIIILPYKDETTMPTRRLVQLVSQCKPQI